MLGMAKALWRYRNFVLSSVRNDIIRRFQTSKFGTFWVVLNPLIQVAIFALILSNVLSARLTVSDSKYSYAIYLMSGLLAWMLFSEIITRSINVFVENGNLMQKINFPRITLPAIIVTSSVINNLLLLCAILLIFILLGHNFTLTMIWIIPLTIVLVLLAISIGLILGILNVFIRDVAQVMQIIMQILFWFTPIVYPVAIIPESYRNLLKFNPFYPISNSYQQVMVYGNHPEILSICILAIIGLLTSLLALFVFRRSNPEMVDML